MPTSAIRPRLLARVAAVLTLVLAAVPAGAQITFSPLTGPNGAAYAGHTEAGFAVAPTAGVWLEGLVFGSPAPSIFAGRPGSPSTSAVRVTRGGDLFTFAAVDLSSNGAVGTSYTIVGSLGPNPVFTQTGVISIAGAFVTVAGVMQLSQISALSIQLASAPGVTSYNVDNIAVSPLSAVPEPATLALLGTGLVALGALRGRHRVRRPVERIA